MSDIGIYGLIYDSPARGGNLLGRLDPDTLSMETLAVGGCWQCTAGKAMPMMIAEDWYEKGLARVIVFYDQDGAWVWEGFVNKVTLNVGDTSQVRGPMMDIANRVDCTYTPRDFSVYPPVDGSQTQTTILEDTLSQARYGILESIVSAGTTTEATAIKVQTRFLNENNIPKTTSQISISPGSSQSPVITIELLGKVHWMMKYIYENTSNGLSYLSDKIIDLVAANPNIAFSTNYTMVDENQYLVNDLEEKMRFAWDILSELLSLGNDTDDDRRIFGIYENGIARYNKVPSTIDYEYRIASFQEIRLSYSGVVVKPWRIKPGRWITIPDFLVGRNIPSPTNLNGDPRTYFIESVKYDAPYSVDLSGGQTDRLSQMLAKITYTGGIY